MKQLTVEHYAKLYKGRIEAAESGISTPTQETISQMRDLVDSLEKLDPNKEIKLNTSSTGALFICNNQIIGKIDKHRTNRST